MERTLGLSRRPFIVLSVCLSPAIVAACYGIRENLLRGDWRGAAEISGIFALLIGFMLSQLRFTKVRVTDAEIAICGWLGVKQRVRFSEISFAKVNSLLEKDWPVSIAIYCTDYKRPTMVIPAKLLKRADIAWLRALPALKVRD